LQANALVTTEFKGLIAKFLSKIPYSFTVSFEDLHHLDAKTLDIFSY